MAPLKRRRQFWLISWMALLAGLMGSLLTGVQAQQDLTPTQLQQAQYVRSCGTCHVALPAQVLPTESWQQLLQDPDHYGQQIQPLTGVAFQLAWGYLQPNSRPLRQGESVPYRLAESRYFRALHLQVDFPAPVRVSSCVECHPKVEAGDFASVSPEWQS
ncbi:hypothetical protein [Synechococcus sp. H65.1]|uniref:hypothetical protein n=1 Tax=unclassified Synechococcus TaxID=2626047 RepID=UPI0039C49DD3